MSSLRCREVQSRGGLREFVDLPRSLYAGDPLFVPPMTSAEVGDLDPAHNPFFRHAETAFWLLHRDGVPAGRISATIDRLSLAVHGDATGVFGHFEATDAECAARLLETAAAWLRARGMRRVLGPIELSTNHRCGLLVDGFDDPPAVMMNYNPPWYADWLAAFGLRKEKDLLAFRARRGVPDFERIDRIAHAALRRAEATDRPFDKTRFWEEVRILHDIYNRSWEANWGFVPMTEDEFRAQARAFRPILTPDLCRILERRGEPIGFVLAIPDVNPAIRACDGRMLPFGFLRFLRAMRKLDRVRVITLGLVPEHRRTGLDAALINRIVEHILAHGYDDSELSWVLEDNVPMVKPLVAIAGPPSKRYRIFARSL